MAIKRRINLLIQLLLFFSSLLWDDLSLIEHESTTKSSCWELKKFPSGDEIWNDDQITLAVI
jgi:hypothetical protein